MLFESSLQTLHSVFWTLHHSSLKTDSPESVSTAWEFDISENRKQDRSERNGFAFNHLKREKRGTILGLDA